MSDENLCNEGRCKQVRMGMKRHRSHNLTDDSDEEIDKSQTVGFDDLVIDITKHSISQQLSYHTSIRIRAAIFMGFGGILLNLLVIMGYDAILSILKDLFESAVQNQNLVPLYYVTLAIGLVTMAVLIVVVIFGLITIWPSKKLFFFDPSDLDKMKFNYIEKTKRLVKTKLLKDLKLLKENNEEHEGNLRVGFKFLLFGLVLTGIFLILTTPNTVKIFL